MMHRFDFGYLYNFTHDPSTPQDFVTRPYADQSILTLTYDGCINAVGGDHVGFSRQDMYERLLLWRVPLITLWLTTVLPAFGFWPMFFTLVHLIADPIDAVWSMLYKLDLARSTIRWARNPENELSFTSIRKETDGSGSEGEGEGEGEGSPPPSSAGADLELQPFTGRTEESGTHLEQLLSACAIIVCAYDEWGLGDEARRAMEYFFNSAQWMGFGQREALKKKCKKTAFSIASDRVARLLPSFAASIAFLASLSAGFWKTLNTVGDSYDGQNPVSAGLNRVPHNIAFGVLFFWLPFVVLMTGVIGGSQTSQVVPVALKSFKKKSDRLKEESNRLREESNRLMEQAPSSQSTIQHQPEGNVAAHSSKISSFPDIEPDTNRKWRSGGIPVWQPNKFKQLSISNDHCAFAWIALFLSIAIVAIPTGCAIAISWLTPTKGFGCRAVTQLLFSLIWLLNVIFDLFLSFYSGGDRNRGSRALIVFWITLIKDFIILGGTATALALGAEGFYNSCNCWCKWPSSGGYISFLQDDFIFQSIKGHLKMTFPLIAGCALLVQLILFIGILIYYWGALDALTQRDLSEDPGQKNWVSKLKKFYALGP